jgi:hypothetical protein
MALISKRDVMVISLFASLSMILVLSIVGCYSPQSVALPGTPEPSPADATPTDVWSGLFQKTPYPYHTPLPPPTQTPLDGTYTKFELKEGTPVPCKRCPDYAPEGGIWKLNFDRGIFRVFHEVTGWRSLGSYSILGDQLVLVNDPYCPDVVGTYTWQLQAGELILKEVEDECAIRLRAMNLTQLPWRSCRPPSGEAGVTDHWPKPPGCD